MKKAVLHVCLMCSLEDISWSKDSGSVTGNATQSNTMFLRFLGQNITSLITEHTSAIVLQDMPIKKKIVSSFSSFIDK